MSFGSAGRQIKISGVFLLVAAALFLAGCPTPPKEPLRVTPLSGKSYLPREREGSPATVQLHGDPELAAPRDLKDSILPEEALQIPDGLLPLEMWASICGFYDLRVVPGASPYTVELENDQGVLTLILGQRFARWNGINLGLGFVPGVKQGKMVVHSLDVAKNFYPLSVGMFTIPKRQRVLVLDPGHGGNDPGSLSPSGRLHEKDLTLDWALRIQKLLEGTSWKVVLTRTEDRDLSLLDRVAVADANQADLFISLHYNSLPRTSTAREESGIETYCLSPTGAPSNITRNFEDDLKRVYTNNEFDAENLLLAMRVQQSLVKATGQRDRGVRRARFMTVLREQKRPAVLIEGGFLSSQVERTLVLDPAHREKMALAVCNALPN